MDVIIQHLKPSELKPYEKNNRKHPKEQVEKLCKQIEAHGFDVPIVVDSANVIIKGHARHAAAKKLKLKTVPVIVRADLTPEQCAAARLADNKLSELAEIDMVAIQAELDALKAIEFDLDLTAFDSWNPFAVESEEGTEGMTDPDDVPELKPDPKSKLGDVWLLGEHRVMCGDSTDAASVAILMNGQKADLCLTDPPYGLGEKKRSGKNSYDIFDDSRNSLIDLASKWLPMAQSISKVVVFSPGINNVNIYPQPEWIMCWFYGGGQLKSSWGFNCWQPFLCYGKDPSFANQKGARPDAVDMNTPANAGDIDHPCPKPVKLWQWFIERLSFRKDDLFFEPFTGSGTTIIACEKTGRKCYGMELSPQYVDVIIKRWQDFTGKKATREDGVQFDDL